MRATLRTLLAILVVIVSVISAESPAFSADCPALPPGFQLRTWADAGTDHKYALFLPHNYTPEKKWPVVLFLHGAGEKGTDGLLPLSGTLAVALEKWQDAPFIAVFPQCEDLTGRSLTAWLANGPSGQQAMAILAQVEKDFSVDPAHRSLVGWSMGGYGAWSLAAAHPRHWSRVLTLAGGAVPGTVDLTALAESRTPVWAISGKQDPLISYHAAEDLIAELNKLGGNGTFTLLDPAGHNICPTVFGSDQTFNWLLQTSDVSPKSVTFQGVKPLPLRTEFYRNCIQHPRRISDAVAIRMGNAALSDLSTEIPAMIPQDALSGKLPDIQRNLGSPASPVDVKLSGLDYHCQVTGVKVYGISGGRLGVDVLFRPITLNINATSFKSGQHSANAGPIQIQIGIRQPAILRVEVQPQMQEGKVKLVLLRKSFLFDDSNWYITPPEEVRVSSPKYTKDQLASGIVGGLYGARSQLVDQFLSVVPDLVHRFEDQLGPRPASSLSKVFSPLPALIPELEVAPSAVSVNSGGIAILGDVLALSRVAGDPLPLADPVRLTDVPVTPQMSASVSLETLTKLTSLTVAMDAAQVNVLDISDDKFAVLADPTAMQRVLPQLDPQPAGTLKTVLHLLSPMQLKATPPDTTAATGGDLHLLLSADRVGLDISDERQGLGAKPVGRILFKLSQPLTLRQFPEKNTDPGNFALQWDPTCEVTFLSAESLQGSAIPTVEAAVFETLFRDAWLNWAASHGTQPVAREVLTIGTKQIILKQISPFEDQIRFELGTQNRP